MVIRSAEEINNYMSSRKNSSPISDKGEKIKNNYREQDLPNFHLVTKEWSLWKARITKSH
jgi:hypothetical protein